MTSYGKGVSIFAAASVAVLTLSGAAGAADWPQFHRDAARTGFNADETILDASNVSDLSVRWSTPIGGVIATPPVVAGGKVFAGSDDGKLYALDAQSGAVLWTGQTGASIRLAPAVDGSRVYVGSEDAVVYAFPVSCSTPCAPAWTAALAGRPTSAPAVMGDAVYVGAGSGASGELWAFDGPSGAVLWQAPLSSSPGGVAVANDVVFASGTYGFPSSCATPCAPVWIAGSDGMPAVSDGLLFVDAGFVNNRFEAYPVVCAIPCHPVWVGATSSGQRNSVPAIAEGRVFWNDGDGTLAAFPAAGCGLSFCLPTWAVSIGGFVSAPAVANGIVYVGSDSSSGLAGLRAFDAATGAMLASVMTGDATLTPAIVDGSVYLSTVGFIAGGRILRLSLPNTDVTPPAVTVPADMTVNATSPTGAVISYTASATDDVHGAIPVTCAPPSGSTFPIGTTTVNCLATDTAGNTASESFTVHVKGASEQVADLIALVDSYNLGLLGTALHEKLVKAQGFLAANKPKRACEVLDRFLAQVKEQRGKRISVERADGLTADARRIKAVVGC